MIGEKAELIVGKVLGRMQQRRGRAFLNSEESRLMEELRHSANASLMGIYLFDDKQTPYSHIATSNFEGFLNEYEQYRPFDPVLHNVLRHGSVTEASEVLGLSGWERHPLCQFMSSWRLRHTIQAPLTAGDRIVGTLNLARDQDRGGFKAEDVGWIWEISQAVSQILEKEKLASRKQVTACLAPTGKGDEPQDTLIIESDDIGNIFSETGRTDRFAPETPLGQILQKNLEANLLRIRRTGVSMATRSINTPPPNSEQLVIVTSVILSDHSRFLTTVMELGRLAPQTSVDLEDLSPRSKSVAELLLRGYSMKMIARELGISENTVKDHTRKIYAKYGAHNRVEFAWRVNSPLKIN